MRAFLFIVFLIGSLCTAMTAQTYSAWIEKAYSELEKKGITEAELSDALDKRGINLEDLKLMGPDEAVKYQSEVEGVVTELSKSKEPSKVRKNKTPSAILAKSTRKTGVQRDSVMKMPQDSTYKLQVSRDSVRRNIIDTSVEIWGRHMFRNKSLALYESSGDAKAPSTYVLGSGDMISVSIWGVSQYSEEFEVNSEGYITPSRMPRIFLKGTTLGRAKSMLSNYFRRFYRFESNQFEVQLASSRTVQINIVGEVEHYGSFTLPAINSVFNALVAAGGPSKIGSVRKIKLIRNGKEQNVDLYKYLMNPNSVGDISIINNDYIHVPVAGRVVTIKGAVNRPMKYELLDGEELNTLVFYSGGLRENAIRRTVQVERIDKDRRTVLDIPYAELLMSHGDFKLRNGDIVRFFEVKTANEDFVFTKGEVRSESSYNYVVGMTLGDLVRKMDFTYESDLQNAFLHRNNPDNTTNIIRVNLVNVRKGQQEANLKLQPRDMLEVLKQSSFAEKSYVTSYGALRSPGRFPFNVRQDMRVKDLVILSGGARPGVWDEAFLFRSSGGERNDQMVVRIPIGEVLSEESSPNNIFLQPYDSLVLLSTNQFLTSSYVEVSGSVNAPGRFQYSRDLKLKDLITFAGGFTISAANNKIDVYRIQIKDNQPTKTIVKTLDMSRDLHLEDASASFALEPFDLVVVRSQPNFEMQKMVYLEGEVMFPGPYAIISSNEKITDLIKRAGGLSPESFPEGATLFRTQDDIGYIVMDLPEALKNNASRNNILVKDKDVISIPKRRDFVRISGETNVSQLYPDKLIASNNTVNVAYYEGKRANYYVNNFAAGVNDNGDKNKITVEHSNGRVESTRRTLFGRVYPKVYKGSIINVGAKTAKEIREKKDKKDIDWAKVVADSIAQATGVLSLILLIQRLN